MPMFASRFDDVLKIVKSWTCHKNTRCRAEVSKTMLPYGRGVNLQKSNSFIMEFEQIQTNHKKWCSNWSLTIEQCIERTSNKWCATTSKHITNNTPNFQMLASMLEPFAWHFPGLARLVVICFSELLDAGWGGEVGWVSALADVYIPGASLVQFVLFFGKVEERICAKCQRLQSSISILCKQMASTTPSTKTSKVKKQKQYS